MAIAPLAGSSHTHWLAKLSMQFAVRDGKTRLKRTEREGPLSVQRAFYPEHNGVAHLYLLHPPAGIVSGDELHISASLGDDSAVLLTTPGANRFYRSRESTELANRQCQYNRFCISGHASLEYLPHETLVYARANAFSHTEIHIDEQASYVGWDIACLGLPHIDQPFAAGQFTQTLTLHHQGRVRFHDRLTVTGGNRTCRSRIGLNGHHVTGTMVAFDGARANSASHTKHLVEVARQAADAQIRAHQIAVSQLQGVVVIRYLGDDSEACRLCFNRIWTHLRPHISGRVAITPRIWYT